MRADPMGDTARMDHAADQRQFVLVAVALGGTLSLAISLQAVVVLGVNSAALRGIEAAPLIDLVLRVTVNLIGVALAALLAARVNLISRVGIGRIAVLLGCTATAAAVRAGLQVLFGFYPNAGFAAADAAIATLLMAVTFVFALQSVSSRRRARDAERRRAAQAAQASDALASLQNEELRVRREIADTLHGNVQGRVVILQAELTDLARGLDGDAAARLDRVRAELDDLRENELRAFSATVYPEGIDRGLVPALRALTDRIPPAIDVSLTLEPAEARPQLELARRLAVVRAAEEGVSNALRHGSATRIRLTLELAAGAAELRVRDDGVGVADDVALSGLARLRDRMRGLGGTLELAAVDGGAELVARMPLA